MEDKFLVNFFRPQSEHAKASAKMIVILVSIWAVAVFGFQFLLIATQKPTKEPSLVAFEKAWPKALAGEADVSDKREIGRSLLMVYGKKLEIVNSVEAAEHKSLLRSALNATLRSLAPVSTDEPLALTAERAAEWLQLGAEGFDPVLKTILPYAVTDALEADYDDQVIAMLPEVMAKYTIHNRSFLTDFTFLGFPFHYWFTGQFLLILFVLLCLFYAKTTDKLNAKHGFE